MAVGIPWGDGLIGAHFYHWSSVRLHRNDQFSKQMLRISSCDVDQTCCWHRDCRLVTVETHVELPGPFPSLSLDIIASDEFFPSLIGCMTYSVTHVYSLCGRPLCSSRSFYRARMEKCWKSFWQYYFAIGSPFQYVWRLDITKYNDWDTMNLKIIYHL